MQTLFLLLYRYRTFLFFLGLEGLCAWLIIRNNSYQGALFFNSSNVVVGYINSQSAKVIGYFSLDQENERLSLENAKLRAINFNFENSKIGLGVDSLFIDSSVFRIQTAKVINNSVRKVNNYITINKGSKDGVYPEMGLIGPMGIVGKVKDVSKNYSTAYSILHTNVLTSVYHQPSGNNCTLQWDGLNPKYSKLLYLPRHVEVEVGDTILTSGFNVVYPSNLMVGRVDQIEIADNEAFYNIKVALSTDFNSLAYIYLIDNTDKDEIKQIESTLEN